MRLSAVISRALIVLVSSLVVGVASQKASMHVWLVVAAVRPGRVVASSRSPGRSAGLLSRLGTAAAAAAALDQVVEPEARPAPQYPRTRRVRPNKRRRNLKLKSKMTQRRVFVLILSLFRDIYNNIEEDAEDDEQMMMMLLIKKRYLRGFRVAPPRLESYLDRIVPRYTIRQFRSHFRIAPETANELENRIAPLLVRAGVEGRLPINPRTQILVTLWILATPDSYRSMEVQFGMGKSSLHHCFIRVIHSLRDIASNVICWPEDYNIDKIKEEFKAKAGMPDVIGAIDGSHIEIEAPKIDPASYRTSKKKHAIQLQAVCDASLMFTDCFVGYPGAVHDARVLSNSPLHRDAVRNERALFPNGEYIIGDKGYQPVRTWLITPYKDTGALARAHIDFNNIHSRTRQVIERAFALLKGRFRRLKHLHMDLVHEIPCAILACCVLHNLCLQGFHENERDIEEFIREGEENNVLDGEQDLYEELPDNDATPGQRKRNYLKDRLT